MSQYTMYFRRTGVAGTGIQILKFPVESRDTFISKKDKTS
jgi:hypothetical protein